MPKIIQVTLTTEQQDELPRIQAGNVCTVTAVLLEQLQMVDLSHQGQTAPQIARALGVSQQMVRKCLKAFLHGGFTTLPAWPVPAAPAAPRIVLVSVRLRPRKEGQATTKGVAPSGGKDINSRVIRINLTAQRQLLKIPQSKMSDADLCALFRRLWNMIGSTAQMRRLLGLVSDAVKLETFLKLAGGEGQAARLETLINLAVNKDADRVADLLNLPECRAVAKFERLADAVPLFKQTRVSTLPPPLPTPSNLASPSGSIGAQAFSAANMLHFLEEHTYEYFDFAKIGGGTQSFWPTGTSSQDVADALEQTINILRSKHIAIAPYSPEVEMLADGTVVQIGIRNYAGMSDYIGQFYPKGPPTKIAGYTKDQLRAIERILVL